MAIFPRTRQCYLSSRLTTQQVFLAVAPHDERRQYGELDVLVLRLLPIAELDVAVDGRADPQEERGGDPPKQEGAGESEAPPTNRNNDADQYRAETFAYIVGQRERTEDSTTAA